MNPRQLFGGLLSVILLLLFLFLLWEAFRVASAVVACGDVSSCISDATRHFGSPMEAGLNTIGGLISAIVIAELAITKPLEVPAARLFAAPGTPASGPGQRLPPLPTFQFGFSRVLQPMSGQACCIPMRSSH